ncbi:hypothetical protein KAX17_12055 [Candidatus Bipolaricaulota bacterium]|nr:hypothetical protein [Candidatus Bipolaricaulota bacterium]
MEALEALEIIKSLADGVDPYTGQKLPEHGLYQNTKTVRALFVAVRALEDLRDRESRKKNLPSHAGIAWTEEEESRLAKRFDEGISIQELAREHQRTIGAIEARLVKLGKIEPPEHRFSP